VVSEGALPEHGAWFTEVAAKGYAIPLIIARNPEVGTNLGTQIDKVIKSGASSEEFAKQIAAYINGGS
jgi:multiple sugar transport system substrate-binding protein